MSRFEYKWVERPYESPDKRFEYLNKEGRDSWELISILHSGMLSVFVFKRRIP